MGNALKVGFISLGCAKNLVDTESMIGLVLGEGLEVTNRRDEADVLVVNTCGFIEAAKKESIEAILEAARAKETGRCRALVVAGCLVSRYKEELLDEIPEIDAVIGTADYPRIVEVVRRVWEGQRVEAVSDPDAIADWNFDRVLTTPSHTAYLKIAEGCNCACSFCSIPLMRGHYRSRPVESVLEEAWRLAGLGVKELIVVSQDTSYYGLDRYRRLMLPELLRRLAEIPGLRWIRVHYLYPTRVTDELIDVLATEPKVVRYLDVPLQHGSPRVLRLMNRPADPEAYLRLLARVRERVPGVTLRSTFITGHPGETEEDFEQLLDFLRRAEIDHVGVFAYSQEEDTPSGRMSDQVPPEVREERRRRAMTVQRAIALRLRRQRVGSVEEVLVERPLGGQPGWYVGRTQGQSPDVDGVVRLHAPDAGLRPGDFVAAEITGVRGYDLVARLAPEAPTPGTTSRALREGRAPAPMV
ncbi:30S ribosomal protein S12 methylthiotransferase RimO [Caldinitratiruptor microaerophilus]|uniref:Ribosomal protein uS12 methylthiotransferase RimO n=1 Tax=Caldinitratiruptor microaerophilus TaxID=671077 RepID=A0AA35CNG7_9FIRM|nr:30S ribosomal protein S12 methylthiotransferase RimO [Caldinitratiruptor microaerophilus]BDG60535.1 ribosomal protein S12 methylthiotransferase RimO [Caldinitratiruptor microaerophilus]